MTKAAHFLFAVALWRLCTSGAWAIPVVEWNTVNLYYEVVGAPTYSFALDTEMAGGEGAAVSCGGTIDIGGLWTTINAYGVTAGLVNRWFAVDYGELIDWDTALASDAFADNMTGEFGSLYLDQGESIYLGFRLGGQSPMLSIEYGWAELYFDGYEVSVLSSATERTGLGIYAGTGTVIPEPATTGLLLMGAAALVWKRRRGGRLPPCGGSPSRT